MLVRVWLLDLAERVAGDQRGGTEPAGQGLTGLEHQPPLRHDQQPVRAGGLQGLLRLAERHHEQPRPALEPVEAADQRVGLVDRLRAGQRHAGEVQEEAAQAAAHHPVGGHRGVDAARHQHDAAAAHPDRQAALSRHPPGEDEHLLLIHLDEHRGVRAGQVDPQPVRLLDLPADAHAQLRRAEREPLVPAAGSHREGARGVLGQRHRGGGNRLGRLGHPQRQADADDAGHVLHPLRDLARGPRPALRAALLAVGDAQQDDSLALADVGRHADVAQRGADIGVQDALELLPVPPLEHDLAQLEQHARLIGAVRAQGIGERRHSPSLPGGNPCTQRIAVLPSRRYRRPRG